MWDQNRLLHIWDCSPLSSVMGSFKNWCYVYLDSCWVFLFTSLYQSQSEGLLFYCIFFGPWLLFDISGDLRLMELYWGGLTWNTSVSHAFDLFGEEIPDSIDMSAAVKLLQHGIIESGHFLFDLWTGSLLPEEDLPHKRFSSQPTPSWFSAATMWWSQRLENMGCWGLYACLFCHQVKKTIKKHTQHGMKHILDILLRIGGICDYSSHKPVLRPQPQTQINNP